jgi:predicted nucleic-acid-binding Zn-ribbon protein/peroxiredoxin
MTTTGLAPAVGTPAPDVELTDALGHPVRLASLWQHEPLVLAVLGRPGSPFYADLALQVRDARELFERAGADVAAIADAPSPELIEANLRYLLLIDQTHAAAKAFGLSDDQAGSFVIDMKGVVRFAHANDSAADSPAAWTLVDAVCAITGATVERPKIEPAELATRGERAEASVGMQLQRSQGRRAGPYIENYQCPKCSHTVCEVKPMSTAGGWLSRIFDFQYRNFSSVTCAHCTYTELYKSEAGALANIFDLIAGG